MSDYVKRDKPADLWNEILERHWRYLEMEENEQKLAERKKLDACLKEFVCIAPHDRKFFLPETQHVLKKSICELKHFSALNAMIGFDAISQYANNLCTKPWRKEYRTLKLYSGFYQHEIKSNLVDAEQLFEAMGYRRLSNDVLVFDGPICPDQVFNVSRDAMVAYMECQIIKQIYAACVKHDLSFSWLDIYDCREKYIGDCTQTLEALTYGLQERRLRKDKMLNKENCYGSAYHATTATPACCSLTTAQCANCSSSMHIAHAHDAQYAQRYKMHPLTQQGNNVYNTVEGGGVAANKLIASYPTGNYRAQPFTTAAAHMSHSRSLEHYNEPHASLPHRHSFDHQQQGCSGHRYNPQLQQQHVYESPYDCLDGDVGGSLGSNVSYATVLRNSTASAAVPAPACYAATNANEYTTQHASYNVSGNRYPLPYNVANQFSADYATPVVSCNGIKADVYSNVDAPAYATVQKTTHNCAGGYQQLEPPLPPVRNSSRDLAILKQQLSLPPDHVIDYDEHAALTKHDFHEHLHALAQHRSFDCERQQELQRQKLERRSMRNHLMDASLYAQPKDVLYNRQAAPAVNDDATMFYDDGYDEDYAKPLPRVYQTDSYISKQQQLMAALTNNELGVDNKTQQEFQMLNGSGKPNKPNKLTKQSVYQSGGENSDHSCGCDYYDNMVHVSHSEKPATQQLLLKRKEGVGSFEQWDYVFKNLDHSGYGKDVAERGDTLMQSLDLNSLNLANGSSAENSSSNEKRPTQQRLEKSQTLEKTRSSSSDKRQAAAVAAAVNSKMNWIKPDKTQQQHQQQCKTQNSTAATVGTNTSKSSKSVLKQNSISSSSKVNYKMQNNLNNNLNESANTLRNNNASKSASSEQQSAVKRKTNVKSTGTSALSYSRVAAENNAGNSSSSSTTVKATANNATTGNAKEWECKFCTYLNPIAVRVCEMCAHSKDFNAAQSNTTTCV